MFVVGLMRGYNRAMSRWTKPLFCALLAAALLSACRLNGARKEAPATLDREGFFTLMKAIENGWNSGNAQLAASSFAKDALYSGPPGPVRRGRTALYEFFGGSNGRKFSMHMTWHNLAFDPVSQVGVGEYTFRYQIQTHGLVIVRVRNGKIANWREYEMESQVPWEAFVGENRF